jgi:LmbE family N-acetylglucosaminyl deacetylase
MINIVLAVVAHADDEALGCAGTLHRHVLRGDVVHLLVMTDGVGARKPTTSSFQYERASALEKSAAILGITSVTQLALPDNALDTVPLLDVIKEIEYVISRIQPTVIYTHHVGDLNVDHEIVCRAVMTACRPIPSFSVCEIYSFEVLSSTEWSLPNHNPFTPNVYIDVTNTIENKIRSLQAYQAEMRDVPHSRSVENAINLAKFRGNSVGISYAEAFVLLRRLEH